MDVCAWGAPGFLEVDPAAEPDHEPTPQAVAEALAEAYDGHEGWIGVPLCATPNEDAHAASVGTSLTYGEIHRDGLTKLLGPRGLDIMGRGARCFLELGSGRGRLALQAFLQFPALHTVVGVELVATRHKAAVDAVHRLCDKHPDRFTLGATTSTVDTNIDREQNPNSMVVLVEDCTVQARRCELRLGDFLDIPIQELGIADAILLEVVMPAGPGREAAHKQLCGHLAAHCKHGCVIAAYEDLHSLWRSLPPGSLDCPFHRLELCEGGYATSWSPVGHHFHGFLCNRECPASIEPGTWL